MSLWKRATTSPDVPTADEPGALHAAVADAAITTGLACDVSAKDSAKMFMEVVQPPFLQQADAAKEETGVARSEEHTSELQSP